MHIGAEFSYFVIWWGATIVRSWVRLMFGFSNMEMFSLVIWWVSPWCYIVLNVTMVCIHMTKSFKLVHFIQCLLHLILRSIKEFSHLVTVEYTVTKCGE